MGPFFVVTQKISSLLPEERNKANTTAIIGNTKNLIHPNGKA